MPRVYIKKRGSRHYQAYEEQQMLDALDALLGPQPLSIRAAASKFGVTREALRLRSKGKSFKKPGGQTVLSEDEESTLCKHIICLAEWGFPVDVLDLRLLVKSYLDKNKRNEARFKKNLPGVDWANAFIARNNTLSRRVCNNINPRRAKVSPEDIQTYFNYLSQDITDIEPKFIINYDETNLIDDPGKRKGLVKRGQKHFDRVMPSAKTAVSVMFAGTASGTLLPPYVVYKAKHMWDSWMESGPLGARYNASKSGWFDLHCFEDWFVNIVVPYFKREDPDNSATKVLIGDNLSSHFCPRVLEACVRHNILFKCLPPNSTHLCQPLDVSLYGPMKRYWRDVLMTWKTNRAATKAVMTKDVFPNLLKKLLETMKPNLRQTIVSGFQKCGIYPLNANKVLSMLPPTSTGIPTTLDGDSVQTESSSPSSTSSGKTTPSPGSTISECVIEILTKLRYEKDESKKRRKRVNVEPGQSVTVEHLQQSGEGTSTTGKTIKRVRRCLEPESDSDNSESPSVNEVDEMDIEDMPIMQEGSWILARFSTKRLIQYFVGQVMIINRLDSEDWDIKAKFLRKSSLMGPKIQFVWPEKEDLSEITMDDAIKILPEPDFGRRGELYFPSYHFKNYSVE